MNAFYDNIAVRLLLRRAVSVRTLNVATVKTTLNGTFAATPLGPSINELLYVGLVVRIAIAKLTIACTAVRGRLEGRRNQQGLDLDSRQCAHLLPRHRK